MLPLAWRNVWRNRNRSLMTAGAVAVVLIIILSYFSLIGALQNGIYFSATRATGHLQVHVADYRETRRFQDLLIDDAQHLQDVLSETFAGARIISTLAVPGLLESNGRSYGIVLQGMDQPREAWERFASQYLTAGALPTVGKVDEIALGEKLAANLQVAPGDLVYMYAPGTDGLGAAAYQVTGILSLPNSEAMAVTSLAAAQELAAPEAINRLEVIFPTFIHKTDDGALPALRARLAAALGEAYSVETWFEVSPELAGFIDLTNRIRFTVSLIFFILAGLLVANTMYLGVIERIREFGLLLALGTRQRKVVVMVLLESTMLCLSGSLAGLTIAAGVIGRMAQGIQFPREVADFLAEQGLPRILHGSVESQQILLTLAFTFLMAVLAALLPALSAGRLEPAEALRFTA